MRRTAGIRVISDDIFVADDRAGAEDLLGQAAHAMTMHAFLAATQAIRSRAFAGLVVMTWERRTGIESVVLRVRLHGPDSRRMSDELDASGWGAASAEAGTRPWIWEPPR